LRTRSLTQVVESFLALQKIQTQSCWFLYVDFTCCYFADFV
jgi:hypothetical protein